MVIVKNKKDDISLNLFYRDNSLECQITRKALYTILDKYPDAIMIQEINYDDNREICETFHVYGVPTLLIISNNKVINRYSGILDTREIDTILKSLLKNNNKRGRKYE